jgi:hypothetical protein
MTESLPYPPPQPEDHEMLRDAFFDLEATGFTTIPADIHIDQFIYWLRRYRGLDGVNLYEANPTATVLSKD